MNYRKLRKAYKRLDGGCTVKYDLYDKQGKKMKKASRKASCWIMKECLKKRCGFIHFFAEELRKEHGLAES